MTDTEKRLNEMEEMNLVEKTGKYRHGQPVWKMTAWARQLDAEDLDRLVERGPVDTHNA